MSQLLGTFDFKKVSVIFGVTPITGFAEGDSIEVSQENDAFNSVGGADGGVDRVRNHSNFLNITLRLRQTSPTNQVLSALHTTDLLSNVTLPFLIKDRSGDTVISATSSWITKFPTSIAFGNEPKAREWVIRTGSNIFVNVGGNN